MDGSVRQEPAFIWVPFKDLAGLDSSEWIYGLVRETKRGTVPDWFRLDSYSDKHWVTPGGWRIKGPPDEVLCHGGTPIELPPFEEDDDDD